MKKIKFILLAIIAFLRIGFVQSQDLQWIISNGYGKSSTTTAGGTINNNYGNLLSTSFTLSGVSNPNRDPATGNPKAKNNLFIIYKNGRFLNSREQVQYGDPP